MHVYVHYRYAFLLEQQSHMYSKATDLLKGKTVNYKYIEYISKIECFTGNHS